MKNRLFGYLRTNRKGLALISVLGVVTLATILIMALFSVSDAELKAAKNYADGVTARQLADSAVNIVISQIQAGATGAGIDGTSPLSTSRTTWASQPGAIRVYKTSGEFVQGRRLYSSDAMVFDSGTGPGAEREMAQDEPATDWSDAKAVWVDLNDPTLKASTSGKASVRTIFPIVDPRASVRSGNFEAIEGFSYLDRLKAGPLKGVVTSGADDALRVPMPVRWLYVLKDGTMGTVSSKGTNAGQWESGNSGSGTPTVDNPIIGRVAFWTDDETCRVNINTAGEPGYYATPSIFHARDGMWEGNQPMWREYQRYPGHPATVALSSILVPNPRHDPSKYDCDGYKSVDPYFISQYIPLKDSICTLVPKLSKGASADGSVPYAPDDFNNAAAPELQSLILEGQAAAKEHLFPSVDEWIFANVQSSTKNRTLAKSNTQLGDLITPETLERGRFFLSANSKGSELNMFGLPRVAIWPVPDAALGAKFRTGFDSTLAYAASLGSANRDAMGISINNYYFSRRDANSAIEDIGSGLQSPGLIRNRNLMTYLDFMVSGMAMPGGGTFRSKYQKNDSRQILVEIFDYIRTTNLYDAFLHDKYINDKPDKLPDLWDDQDPPATGAKFINLTTSSRRGHPPLEQKLLWEQRPAELSYYTYTAPRFDTIRRVGDLGNIVPEQYRKGYNEKRMTTGAYPGHGQVRPIEWSMEGQTYKGFGRFPTISEVSLQFICTADGKNGVGSFGMPLNGEVKLSGGKTAKRIDPGPDSPAHVRVAYTPNKDANNKPVATFWYSNFPPYPSQKLLESWGCNFDRFGLGGPNDPKRHPALEPLNWNMTLDRNTPLTETQKRVQAVFQIELFVPAMGYTKYAPDFTIVLKGKTIGGFQAKTTRPDGSSEFKSIFNTGANQVVQSTGAYMGSLLGESVNTNNVTPLGGSYGTGPLMAGRQTLSPAGMPNDPNYDTTSGKDIHGGMINFPLVSDFFTVDRNDPIEFRAPKAPLEFEIYASHDWQGVKSQKNATPSQTVQVLFADGKVPVPWLVVYSTEHWITIDGNGNRYERQAVHAPRWWAYNAGGAIQRFEGKASFSNGNLTWVVDKHDYNGARDHDTRGRLSGTDSSLTQTKDGNRAIQPMPSSLAIYGYSPLNNFKGVRSNPKTDLVNAQTPDGDFQDEGIMTDGIDAGKVGMGNYLFYGTDSVRSMVPDHGGLPPSRRAPRRQSIGMG